jgi:hypothetical protein
MAITQTALAADLASGATTMTVSSGTGFPTTGTIANPGYLVRINKEYMWAVGQPVAGTIKLALRGFNGTVVTAHDILSKVEVSASPSDFAPNAPGSSIEAPLYAPSMQTLGEDRTFTSAEVLAFGNQDQTFAILKATAIACVLVAPSKAQDGVVVRFTSLTAVQHVITATSLLANGGTGSPYTTATGADTKIGASLTLQAQNGLWNVLANVGWTLT